MGWIERDPAWLPRTPAREGGAPPEGAVPPAPAGPPAERVPTVIWIPVRCPYCRSRDCPSNGTAKGVPGMRYHRCTACGRTFKSFESLEA